MLYEGKNTRTISFPLGGIGTGSIGLTGNGELRDWEIFNRPNKHSRNGYSHFAIKATYGGRSIVKVLHGDTTEELMGLSCEGHLGFGYGPRENSLAGFPHFKDLSFEGNYPVAELTFSDVDFPAVVRLRAFNPLIPHNVYDSSLPVAFFEWEIENIAAQPIDFALAGTLSHPAASTKNEEVFDGTLQGVLLRSAGVGENEVGYSDLCILTDHADTAVQEYWYRGSMKDGCTTYWKNLLDLDRMPKRHYEEPSRHDHGTVVSYVTVPTGGRERLRFVIAWNTPVAHNYWNRHREEGEKLTWLNYYATQFKDSFMSAKYALANFDSLYKKTKMFSDTLQSCTLPESVKDAISANLSVIKSPTALRLEDGSFWGWEGCSDTAGSCFGTCQHVWNYAYVMPYLFPALERSIRENTMKYALQDHGATSFRLDAPPARRMFVERACLDGQMGEVIKCFREWRLSGDDNWLREHSESIFRMLEYAWSEENPDRWDADRDGILEGRQHHTLDMELFGPSSWLQGFYLLALDCGARMAESLGEEERAALYKEIYRKGRAWTNEHLFNGRYFDQRIDLSHKALLDSFGATVLYWNEEAGEIKYQVGEGCIIDQMLSDWHASLLGLEGVFDKDKKRIALENLYRNNFKSSMREVTNMWRNLSLDDEAGTVICTYPDGARCPAIPIPYCEETMTGFEYALAGLMIAEGYLSEGEEMIRAVRDRYDGAKRNPWNEIECGSNYARSMASFALMPIYSGFTFDMTIDHVGFFPVEGVGKFLFSVAQSWGFAELNEKGGCLTILGEPLTLRSISVPRWEAVTELWVDGAEVDFAFLGGSLTFGEATIRESLCWR